MDIRKVSKIVELAKKNYIKNYDNYDHILANNQNRAYSNGYNLGANNNFNNDSNGTNNSNFSERNGQNTQGMKNFDDFTEIAQRNRFPENNMYPPQQSNMQQDMLGKRPMLSQQQQQPSGPQFNIKGGGNANGMPINIVAKNYIDTNSIEDDERIDKIKKETKSHQLAKIPTNLLKNSATEWEPINFRGVNISYELYSMSRVDIFFDEETQAIIYKIIEPELTEYEKKTLKELKKAFIFVFEKVSNSDKNNRDNDLILAGTRKLCNKYGIKLTDEQFQKITYYLERDFLGLERIEPIMHDPFIEDVSCDGLGVPIFVNHLKYGPLETNRKYTDSVELNSFIIKLAQKSNNEVSLSKPILQGALPDGSRVEAIYGKEVSEKGSSFTIRKFRAEPFTPIHLIEFGTMSSFLLAFLWLAVENKQSLLVSGGTATGKTTILNALSLFVNPTSKIVSIEDTPEINLPHEHWLPLIARESEGKAQVSMFDLLKASLRERPDYIIVGEIRGEEASILFQGMATGHAGMGTVHAEKFVDLVNRMTIAPINLPKQLITELNICIFQKRVKVKDNMVRRTTSVVEVVDYNARKDKFESNEFMKFDAQTDTFNFTEKSFVISHLLEARGGKEEGLWTEIEKRRRILEFMHENKILEFRDVSDLIKTYYKDPVNIFDYMENYLEEKAVITDEDEDEN